MCSSDVFINMITEVNCNVVTDFTVYVCTDCIMRQGHIHIGGGYKVLVA